MAIEQRRCCGFRKVGGLYLMGSGSGEACDRLPIPLTVCPCCSQGIKQSRGWTWIDIALLVGGIHKGCLDDFPCPLCTATGDMGRAGLLWIGEKFYPTVADFGQEAAQLGISRRIHTVPRGFKIGETWVLLAHPKTVVCPICSGTGLQKANDSEPEECDCKSGKLPGIFHVFRPYAIEKIITESQSRDAELMADLQKRGFTPIIVPDDDKDHQGTVYDKEEEPLEEEAVGSTERLSA